MSVSELQVAVSNDVEFNFDDNSVSGVRKLRLSGDSVVVSIPPKVLEVAEFEDVSHVRITAHKGENRIVLTPEVDD